jgi:hypothetical protein
VIDLNKNKTAVHIFWRMSAAAFFIYKKTERQDYSSAIIKATKRAAF